MTKLNQTPENGKSTDEKKYWAEFAQYEFPISTPDLAKALDITPHSVKYSASHKYKYFTEGVHYIIIKNSVNGLPYRFYTREGVLEFLKSRKGFHNGKHERAQAFSDYLEANPHVGVKQTTENGLSLFSFNDHQLQSLSIDGQPWLIANHICQVLDIQNSRQAVASLEDYEKTVYVVDTPSRGKQKMWLVNESGCYSLIFKSRKPEAKDFQKWVTTDLLPTLRKTGRYDIAEWNKNNSQTDTAPVIDEELQAKIKKLAFNVALRSKPRTPESQLAKLLGSLLNL
ncbi:MAG: hypothetical protein JNL70_26555 [Saprospiraceae bacterium]|nr:hypothetical protein [Saprospiraceae bacterium]